jgi:hypothetical protein
MLSVILAGLFVWRLCDVALRIDAANDGMGIGAALERLLPGTSGTVKVVDVAMVICL